MNVQKGKGVGMGVGRGDTMKSNHSYISLSETVRMGVICSRVRGTIGVRRGGRRRGILWGAGQKYPVK